MRRFVLLAVLLAAVPVETAGATAAPAVPARAAVGLTALRMPSVPLVSKASEGMEGPRLLADSTAAEPERQFHPLRFYAGLGTFVAADAVVMVGLSRLWYTGERVKWHWYSDTEGLPDDGWLDDWHTYVQQDKFGHLFVAWQLARVFGAYGRWAGLSDRQAGLLGGSMSALFQMQIELLDGYDPAYGASRTDLLANVVGGAIGGFKVAYPEKLAWFEAKYSYHRSPYYDDTISPNPLLCYAGNAIKDYDGISYWLVVKPEHLLPERHQAWWPDWLGVSIGYSGTGLAHPNSGQTEPRLKGQGLPNVHYRQVFIGPDFDLLGLVPLPRFLEPVRTFFAFVRIPAPALELSGLGTRWHWLYY